MSETMANSYDAYNVVLHVKRVKRHGAHEPRLVRASDWHTQYWTEILECEVSCRLRTVCGMKTWEIRNLRPSENVVTAACYLDHSSLERVDGFMVTADRCDRLVVIVVRLMLIAQCDVESADAFRAGFVRDNEEVGSGSKD